jgi:hypothetical protein
MQSYMGGIQDAIKLHDDEVARRAAEKQAAE